MRRQPADVSVLTPVLDEERHIRATLAAMRRQEFPGRIEFLLADGGSRDATIAILDEAATADPRIIRLDNPRRAVSSGLNVALRHATGRWVARMDAHTVYPSDYLIRGVGRLGRGDTRWVSGPQLPEGSGPVSGAVTLALAGRLGQGGSRKWAADSSGAATGEYDLDTGVFCGVWERATLLEYGGWDEHWEVNEDSEMAARFLERGERLVCVPQMAARYAPRDSLISLWRQYRRYGRFRARTFRRHPTSLRRSALLPPAVVLDAAVALASPSPTRRMARGLLATYTAALVAAAAGAARRGEPAQAALVPFVLATMHAGHGVGMLEGMAADGVSPAAVARVLLGAPVTDPAPPADAVWAPSLQDA